MEWLPQEEQLRQLALCLHNSLDSNDANRNQAEQVSILLVLILDHVLIMDRC